MYVYIWEYQVRPESVERFREVYSPDGVWVALFKRASGYMGTELHRDLDDRYRYVTVDRWESRQAYDRFRRSFSAEFERLDAEVRKVHTAGTAARAFRRRGVVSPARHIRRTRGVVVAVDSGSGPDLRRLSAALTEHSLLQISIPDTSDLGLELAHPSLNTDAGLLPRRSY